MPIPIPITKEPPLRGVAVELTEGVGGLVLRLEVEHVNWEDTVVERVVMLVKEVFLERAVIIVEYDGRESERVAV